MILHNSEKPFLENIRFDQCLFVLSRKISRQMEATSRFLFTISIVLMIEFYLYIRLSIALRVNIFSKQMMSIEWAKPVLMIECKKIGHSTFNSTIQNPT